MFNPLLDKKPYGAVVLGKEITYVFPLETSFCIERVFIVLRKNKTTLRYELAGKIKRDNQTVFAGSLTINEAGIWHYRFEGEFADGTFAFFGRGDDGIALRGDWLPEWQLTVEKSDYKTPDWAKTGLIYHIFADRFCKAGEREFLKEGKLHHDWYETPDYAQKGVDYRADDFFGGNAEGIISKLNYLEGLGVTTLYLSPIFESSSNHRYDTGDYMKIDELFGDEKIFLDLLKEADKKGIRVILDGVFNHTGSDSRYFNKKGKYPTIGAYQSEESPYYDWYYFYDFPDSYHCWWGSTVVPTVNKSAKGYRELILGENGVLKKWQKLGVKGWRLDVVDELPIDFTTLLCGRIKQIDPDAYVVGEVWEDASTKVSYGSLRPYFTLGQLDAVMNYPFKEAILKFAAGGSADEFKCKVTSILENYPKENLDCCMTLLGTHDTVRALTALGCETAPRKIEDRADFRLSEIQYNVAVKRLKLASLLQYTLPGVPCLYYGDEAGMQGFEDPLNRGTYPWGREDHDLLCHYLKLGKLRKTYAELLLGETHFDNGSEGLAFERRSETGVLRVEVKNDCANVTVNGKEVFSL